MKNIVITTAALLVATSAFATDLPSKKKTPLPTPAPVAAVAPASTDSLTVSYGQDLGNNFGAKADDAYQLTYKHNLGNGFSVGGMAKTTQVSGSQLNQNLEVQAGYALPAMAGVTVSGKVGVGEKFTTANFPYYALYGAADYKVMDGLTLNAVQYRYRNSFDTATYSYASHQLATGVTYDINSKYSVTAKVARNFDTTTSFNATGDEVMVGLTVKF